MSSSNADAYRSLGWIMNYSEDGLFFLIAAERMQREIAAYYAISNVAVYDYKKHPGAYSFRVLEDWINDNLQANVYFILNFQLAIKEEKDVNQLNFSRDMLANLGKNLLFCMTQRVDDILARNAYDFYSYIKLRIFFQDEVLEDTEERGDFLPLVFDKSTDIDHEIQIDFKQSKRLLLSQAISLINQAEQLKDNFRYRDALLRLQKALIIREKFLGDNHPDTAAVYQKIADVYCDMGEYKNAMEYYNKALVISKKVLGEEHPDTAATYNNIAGVYKAQGDYSKAMEYYNKALAIRRKVLGEEHPDTAATYNNIAGVYETQGDYGRAMEYYNKALAISERVLGEEHPDTATTYNNIAGVYEAQGDYGRAIEYYNKALPIRRKVLGEDHLNTATTYNNIALVHKAQGDYGRAMEYYNKALAISEKVLGEAHPFTATIYNNIALVYQAQGDNF